MRGKLAQYDDVLEPGEIGLLKKLAEPLAGRSYLHVNSTFSGGGVAEILHRLTAIFDELGIAARWEVIEGERKFFEVTKELHNGLQGKDVLVSRELWDYYLSVNDENARRLDLAADLVFIHDPQPAPLIQYRPREGRWVWRCHIDISHPNRPIWSGLKEMVERYDAAIFSVSKFAQSLSIPQFVIPPTIDPLSDKNRALSQREVQDALDRYEIPTDRPILLQVSRFDPFKDPLGVIRAFRMVRRHHPCRLVLAGGAASDDPESVEVLSRVQEEAVGDPEIHVLNLPPFSDVGINALQRAAAVVLQKSTREGFGLTVTEALWKAKPVVAGAVGGIPLQVHHGVTGFLVHSVEGAAYRIRELLHEPELGLHMGEMGREHVRRNFLITKQARDYLSLWIALEHPDERVIHLGGKSA